MTVTEKVAYIRGLAEGLELDENKKEVKVINAIIDLLEDLSESITDTEDVVTDVEGQLDEVDEDLGNLERFVYGDNESEADDGCGCSCDDGDEDDYYEVTCPNCHETICLSQDIVEDGQMECPNCGEVLEFDLEDDDENSDEDDSAEEDKD
ncbi:MULTISPECIES: CD1247 N-terminal domain-containing protein [Caproicibacterium]|jgi:hypothetical protein|uniref:TFIIB-type domain-containing protein n=1 Tax=Caproicibacterium lactatifermentans TaxID=2666138 RepID=A0A859DRN0_9FIRM|nr:CD1247 N-terminal domain-containing protein [Caproicibacterium lactatifermentans]ARP50161.1 hypothetical protein B6259_04265 [Ruminococcaceae bacterium CPB6]MDD4807551.1 hypothetical protein [Oscillospiraceae bacterium]QKN24115.1 hypothetical protein GJQ69_06250 [Caproicibacterium lactatifermentans]QKO30817.1 hypothetical protein GKP14_07285 [Caproicibacterium lactatifermentans]